MRKIISAALAAIMTLSASAAVFAAPEAVAVTVLDDDFSDGATAEYTAYDDTDTEAELTFNSESEALKAVFGSNWGDGSEGKPVNGIKKDISALLDGEGFEGGVMTVSADVSCAWYDNSASVFVEVNGKKTQLASGGPGGQDWAKETLTGSASVSYTAGDTAFLCITQPCGQHEYDNIKLSFDKISEPIEVKEILKDTFDSDSADYTAYDAENAPAAVAASNGQLEVDPENDWNSDNGIKKDVTALVKSGTLYGASAEVYEAFWGEGGTSPAKLFFEVESSGAKKTISIGEAANPDGDEFVTVSGTAKLEFSDGDKVYICLTQPSGYYRIDNAALYENGLPEPSGKPTDEPTNIPSKPTDEPAKPTNTPADDEVLNDTFSVPDDKSGYAVYDDSDTGAEVFVNDGERLGVNFGNQWSNKNGVKKDITSLVKTGSKYEVSADYETTWWGDTPVKLFFEIKSAGGEVKTVSINEVLGEGESGSAVLKGTADLSFAEGDTVYLCITQAAGTQYYDNIVIKLSGGADVKPSATPTTEPADDSVLNDTFEDSDISGYTVYDDSDTGAEVNVDNGRLVVNFGNSWSDKNGVKKDITGLVKSGSKYEVSADIESTAWGENPGDGPAKLFFEIVTGGTKKAVDIGSVIEDGEISGSAALEFAEGDKVYLCITQAAGTQYYDNIVIKLAGGTDVKPTTTPVVQPTKEPTDDSVLNDTFDSDADAGYEAYDAENAAEITYNGECMDVKLANGWSDKNGVKKDITNLVKSGVTYNASAEISASAWGENPGDGPAKLFFEIVSGGAKKAVDIGSVIEDGEISGSAALTFNSGDKVYICITQPSGYYQIDNVKITASAQETIPPTKPPVGDDALNDTFSDGNVSGYTVYDDANTGAEVGVDNGSLSVNFGKDWDSGNGVKKDITALVTSGSKYEASVDYRTTWWGGTTVKLFFEVVSASGMTVKTMIAEELGDGDSGSLLLSGKADLRYNDGDKVYLCVTQAAGTQYYDNIVLKRVGDADPEPTEDPSKTPEPTKKPIGDTIFTDDFSDAAQGDKYKLYVEYTDADAEIGVSGGTLNAAMGAEHGWTATNGIRRDITAEVSQYISGMTFGAHVELSAYWNSDATGKIFFETIGSDGLTTVTDIASFPIPDGIPSGGGDATSVAEGAAQLNFKAGDTIYLCATQLSGNHKYDNISLWIEGSGGGNAITLTSGKKRGGEFFPESADAIYLDTFSGSTTEEILAKYKPFNDIQFSQDPGVDQGGAMFQFPDGEGAVHGVAVDVTEAFDSKAPNGGIIRAGCKMLPWWWWGSASVKLRIEGKTINVVDYASKASDPGSTWATVRGTADVERKPGDKTELIITMNSGSATGFRIDDVCVELPYDTVMARDIAVENAEALADIKTVDIVYGGSYVTSAGVTWGSQTGSVVSGETDIEGVTARAYITDGNVKKVTVKKSGITVSDYKLEAGKTASASGDNEMVFLLDSISGMNLMSAVSGTGDYAAPQTGTTDKASQMSVSDNGSGITIEGTIPNAAYNDEVIFVKDASGTPVAAERVYIDADGKYSVKCGAPAKGEYTAVMTDTGVSAAFSYASESEFDRFKSKATSGQAVSDLLKDNNNRIVLGANNYSQYNALSESAQMTVCSGFAAQLGDKTRAQAAALFDALVTIQAAASVSESEWASMLEASSEELGIKGTAIYNQYTSLSQKQRESVKSKVAARGASDSDSFKKVFSGAVLNTRLVNAGQYTSIQSILRENSALFDGTGINVNISADAAKYISNHISENDVTIDAIAALIRAAESYAASQQHTGNTGTGGSAGGGRGSGGTSGSNVGLTLSQPQNPNTTQQTPPQEMSFSDLTGFEWAQSAIYALCQRGIINGYGNGTFNPGGNITREEFVKIIVSAFSIPSASDAGEFADVDASRWSHDVIAAASAAGIVTGISETEFVPSANITRQDAAVIIYRAFKYVGKDAAPSDVTFTDSAQIADYAADAVSALSALGIINGMEDGSFAPSAMASRAQAAVMIYRVISTL